MNEYERDLFMATTAIVKELQNIVSGVAWFQTHAHLATKNDLEQIERLIRMTQAEATQAIKDLTAQIVKIGGETSKTLQKVIDLEGVIAAGGVVAPEVVQALADAKSAAQAADDLTPDAPPTP